MIPPEILKDMLIWGASIVGSITTIGVSFNKWFLEPRRKLRNDEIDEKFEKVFQLISDFKEEVKQEFKKQSEDVLHTRLNSKRNEYLLLINNHPYRAAEIERVYSEYSALGGNGYISIVHKAWEEEYGEAVAKERIKKGETIQ